MKMMFSRSPRETQKVMLEELAAIMNSAEAEGRDGSPDRKFEIPVEPPFGPFAKPEGSKKESTGCC